MTPLSDNFTLEELTRSDVALRKSINNVPGPDIRQNLALLAYGLERVRHVLSVPVLVSSGFRCEELNAAIGGASKSAHLEGLAADFTAPEFGSPRQIAAHLVARAAEVDFDTLIMEGTWIHIAFANDKPARGNVLTAHFAGGRATYTKGLV